jgi:cytochrome c-type biogenesis protein CcmH
MRLLATIVLLIMTALPAHAVEPDEILKDPALEARARALSEGLRCLVCQNQSIDDSNAPLARDLRLLLRERLTKGDSDEQAVEYIVSRYGDFVLLKPRFDASTMLLWIGPFAILLLAATIIIYRRKHRSQAIEGRALSPEEREALDRLMRG